MKNKMYPNQKAWKAHAYNLIGYVLLAWFAWTVWQIVDYVLWAQSYAGLY